MAGTEKEPSYVTQADLEKLTEDFNKQLNENMSILRKEIISEVGSEFRKQFTGQGEQTGEEIDENGEEAAAHQAPRDHVATSALRPPPFRPEENGRGRGRERNERTPLGGRPTTPFRIYNNDAFQRGQRADPQLQEEKFGKLKFTIPRFEGNSDPDAYLTWELKVD